jgi:2-polyprenyl-3-methyl-5-hydroxy-6-metoxy-1,4-benzoquinol methylase
MMNKTERFWDNRAAKFEKQPIKDEQAFQNTIEKVKSYLSTTDTVLDYGCGTGTISNLIAENVKKIHAIDISSKMIAFATQKAAALDIDNIQHTKTTLFDNTLDAVQFDAVLAFNILHLSEDMQAVMQRINQLLKAEGLLISTTPCLRTRFSLMGMVDLFLRKLGIVPNLKMPAITELETAIRNADFAIVALEKPDSGSLDCFLVAKKLKAGQ